ncbi:GNAT family N-acetyltransferase [Streptomyces sp. NPDC090022]|uniref:GNAT family N-acetyltransferase n=1 Tax=Streptomyces sp. NPDC090022 TaxID=3365920 RepID=UPI0037F9908B
MIILPARQLPALIRWFPAGPPGPATLTEHLLATQAGTWWADRAVDPRVIAAECGEHVLLRGDPSALEPADLAPFANTSIEAPDRFRPLLGSAFDQIRPWPRIVHVKRSTSPAARPPLDVTVRRLTTRDALALRRLPAAMSWVHRTWGGPQALARSGYAWAALHRDRIVALACTYFLGTVYEEIACVTVPDPRLQHLGRVCVTALCSDIAARDRTPSWTCPAGDRSTRHLALSAGFRPEYEYTHHVVGSAAAPADGARRRAGQPAALS